MLDKMTTTVIFAGVDGFGHDNNAPRKRHEGQIVRKITYRFYANGTTHEHGAMQ